MSTSSNRKGKSEKKKFTAETQRTQRLRRGRIIHRFRRIHKFTDRQDQCIGVSKMIVAVLSLITLLALACSYRPPGRGAGELETSPRSQTSFKVETVIGNLEVVWSIVWAPDCRMIFTERKGRVRVYENGKLRPTPLFTVPDVEPGGESGLMSIALHPQFAANHLLYLSYAYNSGGAQV